MTHGRQRRREQLAQMRPLEEGQQGLRWAIALPFFRHQVGLDMGLGVDKAEPQ